MTVGTVARAARIGRADVLLTCALFAATLLAAYTLPDTWLDGRRIDGLGIVLLALLTLPVLVRRAWPIAALGVCVVPQAVYHAIDYPHEVTLPVAVVLLYGVARTASRTRLVVAVAVVSLVLLLVVGLTNDGPPGVEVILPMGWFMAASVAGQAVRFHHAYFAEVAERRVAQERLRIARDLHDVLAHNIVVINSHAGVTAHLLDEKGTDPELAGSLRTIAAASSAALAELRTTLDVLRGNETDSDRAPTPGTAQLAALADNTRASGVDVSIDIRGQRRELGPGIEVTLYRIAQEALTNVVKHADASRAELIIEYTPGQVQLAVTDDGHGAPQPAGSGGYGIIGMTERASALGGHLRAGPGPDGGFQVVATLPATSPGGES